MPLVSALAQRRRSLILQGIDPFKGPGLGERGSCARNPLGQTRLSHKTLYSGFVDERFQKGFSHPCTKLYSLIGSHKHSNTQIQKCTSNNMYIQIQIIVIKYFLRSPLRPLARTWILMPLYHALKILSDPKRRLKGRVFNKPPYEERRYISKSMISNIHFLNAYKMFNIIMKT